MAQSIATVISGMGCDNVAYTGAKIVMDLARVLQKPIVEPENTFGKKSRCPI